MKILCSIIFVLSIFNCFSQTQLPNINWEKTFGGSDSEIIRIIQPTSDGGYLLGGTTGSNDGDVQSENNGLTDFWVVKIDFTGTIEWEKTYGGSYAEYLRYIQPTSGSGFLLVGTTESDDGDVQSGNNGLGDYWVVKIDNTGNIEWEKTYGGSGDDALAGIQLSQNGGLLLGGTTESNDGDVQSGNIGLDDFWVVKIDNTGTIEWEQTYGSIYIEVLTHHQPTSDGGYLLGGFKFFYPPNEDVHSDFWVVKIDFTGTIEWEKRYGGSKNESLKYIQPTPDGGYLLGGITSSNDGDIQSGNNGYFPSLDFWLVKIDNAGTLQWEKTFGGSNYDAIRTIQPTTDNGYLLGGTTNSRDGDVESGNKGAFDGWVVKIDNTGTLEWEKTFGGSDSDIIWAIQTTSNGDYILGGSTMSSDRDIQSGNRGANDFWVITINIVRILGLERLSEFVKIYPNPTENIPLNIDITYHDKLELQIIDIKGNIILIEGLNVGSNQIEWEGINDGVYILRIIDESVLIHQQRVIKK